MSEASNQPTGQERIDALMRSLFLRMNASARSYTLQRHPDWDEWVKVRDTKTAFMGDGEDDLLRGLRAGLLEVCKQIDEMQSTLVDELRQERHERERLEERVKYLEDLLEE